MPLLLLGVSLVAWFVIGGERHIPSCAGNDGILAFKTPDHFDISCDMIEGTREEMEQLAGIVLSS